MHVPFWMPVAEYAVTRPILFARSASSAPGFNRAIDSVVASFRQAIGPDRKENDVVSISAFVVRRVSRANAGGDKLI
jgi:hypothetical protein